MGRRLARASSLLIPRCVCPHAGASRRHVARLICFDGSVRTYEKPVRASEVTREFPSHLVCHADAFCIGQKVPALREEEKLRPGSSYLLLPLQFFESVVSFVTFASSFAAKANGDALLKVFDVRRTPEGVLQLRINDEFVDKLHVEEEEKAARSLVCTTKELERDYKQLVRCKSELWKPKLETIKEKNKRLEAFESFKRKTKENTPPPLPPPPPPPPPRSSPPMFLNVKSTRKIDL